MAKKESGVRMQQSKKTEQIRPSVSIVSISENPVGTIFCLWWGSRHKTRLSASFIEFIYSSDLEDIQEYLPVIKEICDAYPEYAGDSGMDFKNVIHSIVTMVLKADLPPSESVLLTIEVDNVSVAWREQLVRSRVAGYWTQTSRTFDLRSMDVNMSDSVSLIGGAEAVKVYKDTVDTIRKAYERLMQLGVPSEDIRLQPQSQVHRVYWMINLRQLIKIMNKRSDWIAQASLWTPIIAGILKELRKTPLFNMLTCLVGQPPVSLTRDSLGNLSVSDHKMDIENEDRYYGRDPQPCDPLWLAYRGFKMPDHTDKVFYEYLKSLFIQIWGDEYLEILGWDRSDYKLKGKYDA